MPELDQDLRSEYRRLPLSNAGITYGDLQRQVLERQIPETKERVRLSFAAAFDIHVDPIGVPIKLLLDVGLQSCLSRECQWVWFGLPLKTVLEAVK